MMTCVVFDLCVLLYLAFERMEVTELDAESCLSSSSSSDYLCSRAIGSIGHAMMISQFDVGKWGLGMWSSADRIPRLTLLISRMEELRGAECIKRANA